MSTVSAGDNQEIMVTLATNVRKFRKKAGLSQSELAKSVGVSYPRISEIENGHGNPLLSTVEKIACVLNVKTIDLLREIPPRKK